MSGAHNQSSYSAAEYAAVPTIYSRPPARAPPRIRPCMILIMVMSVGITFVGLVMTIIAVWPGYTPVGGNPLKIAGPCLLGAGGVVFIFGIINACVHKDKRDEKMAEMMFQAQNMQHNMSQETPA